MMFYNKNHYTLTGLKVKIDGITLFVSFFLSMILDIVMNTILKMRKWSFWMVK